MIKYTVTFTLGNSKVTDTILAIHFICTDIQATINGEVAQPSETTQDFDKCQTISRHWTKLRHSQVVEITEVTHTEAS